MVAAETGYKKSKIWATNNLISFKIMTKNTKWATKHPKMVISSENCKKNHEN